MRGWPHILVLIAVCLAANNVNAEEAMTSTRKKLAVGFGLTYLPKVSIKTPSSDYAIEFYDSFPIELSLRYSISEYVAVGFAFEYLKRNIEPDATFSNTISLSSMKVDGRLSYPFTESGKSLLVLGLASGFGRLEEKDEGNGESVSLHTTAGFEFGFGRDFGVDLLYQYGVMRIDIDDIREYRFDGWSLKSSLYYRF